MAIIDLLNAALAGVYRIEREIGAGGMATVYLARDIKHERDVALKLLHDLSASTRPDVTDVWMIRNFNSVVRQ